MNPTQSKRRAEQAAHSILAHLGERELDEHTVDTPRRLVGALDELTGGRKVDPIEILSTSFDSKYDDMVVVSGMPFTSICKHHVLPFTGIATVAYIPSAKVVGLSKIPRLLDALAARLQIQEDLTTEIVDQMTDALDPAGVGVYLTGTHGCMSLRGIKCNGKMTTSTFTGAMTPKRDELFALHLAELQ